MDIIDFKEFLAESYPEAILLDVLDGGIIGVDVDGHVVYSYGKCVQCLMEHDGMSEEEAMEWIDYNTIRAIPYMGENRPIMIYEKEFFI